MFLDELTPVLKKIQQQPLAFAGGFFSYVFRLSLTEDPLKSWLEQQGVNVADISDNNPPNNGSTPQSISIE
jgi:hypothetical protein